MVKAKQHRTARQKWFCSRYTFIEINNQYKHLYYCATKPYELKSGRKQ